MVPETNSLTYRRYPVQELAARCSFEQVAFLLWRGELPTDAELALFSQAGCTAASTRPSCATCSRSQNPTTREWLRGKLARHEKIMGFGHRVYRNGDSRVPAMRQALARVAALRGGRRWLDIYQVLEAEMAISTGIRPNLDFPIGPAYHLMGFDIASFTPIFVMGRITGWTAHIMEQAAANTLGRPLSAYSGCEQRVLPG